MQAQFSIRKSCHDGNLVLISCRLVRLIKSSFMRNIDTFYAHLVEIGQKYTEILLDDNVSTSRRVEAYCVKFTVIQ